MIREHRRTLLKALAAAPAFLVTGAKSVWGASTTGITDVQHKFPGVQLARFMNTAQLWHKNLTGSYALLSELHGSPAVAELRASKQAEQHGLGASLIEILSFDSTEILPGWSWHLKVASDRSGYFFMAQSTNPNISAAFSTDQSGGIYEGRPLDSMELSSSRFGFEEFRNRTGALPIGALPARGARAVLKLASLTAAMFNCCDWGCCQCSQRAYPCCSDCTCQCMDGYPGGGVKCLACGLIGCCLWCCDIY
jgi:hypothetical protein